MRRAEEREREAQLEALRAKGEAEALRTALVAEQAAGRSARSAADAASLRSEVVEGTLQEATAGLRALAESVGRARDEAREQSRE